MPEKTILFLEEDYDLGECSVELRSTDKNVVIYRGENLQDVFGALIGDSRNSFKKTREILANVKNNNIEFTGERKTSMDNIEKIISKTLKEIKDSEYVKKYQSKLEQLHEIKDANYLIYVGNFIQEVEKLIMNCYENDLLLPSIAHMRVVKQLQIRWDTSNLSLIVRGNNAGIDSYIRFKNSPANINISPDNDNLEDLIPLLKQMSMYEWLK